MFGRLVTVLLGGMALITVGVICFSSLAIGLMLHALNVFTQETPVAQVVMYPIKTDESGQYIIIEYTPYQVQDALSAAFNPNTSELINYGTTETYKIYGDVVAIRGPFIKLHDALLLLNYRNIYKLSLIEGEYRRGNNPSKLEGSEFFINGGFSDSWWFLNNDEATFPYNLIVDRFTFSGDEEPGFTDGGRKVYELVITRDTLTWNLKGRLPN